ncbi:nuclear receptor subfamily 5 group A member 2-like isoform X2 [Lineus longissimus]|uniref:nuclear receptor subfamily 5 group A member 2-like isoform X2 n=1 Tax=Lineus longissimus TaxID=88925 RepID=UPI00315C90F9
MEQIDSLPLGYRGDPRLVSSPNPGDMVLHTGASSPSTANSPETVLHQPSTPGSVTGSYIHDPASPHGDSMSNMSHSPGTVSQVTSSNMTVALPSCNSVSEYSQYPPDVKFGIEELCPVCGDKVSGYHYGLLTCESCKGFFKRTVQNKKVYSCVDNRSCLIDKSQRKRCPYCRFQKCLNVGMKLEAVRQDRMRGGRNKFGPMYKRDRAIKQQQLRQQAHILTAYQIPGDDLKCDMSMTSNRQMAIYGQHPQYLPHSNGEMVAPLHPHVMQTMRIVPHLINQMKVHELNEKDIQEKVITFAQYQFMACDLKPKRDLVIGLCKLADHCLFLLVEWARASSFFKELKVEDQMKLLQNCWSELLIIEYVFRFVSAIRNGTLQNLNTDREPHYINFHNLDSMDHLDFLPRLGLSDVKTRLIELIKKFAELKFDINDYVCMKFLVLLNPDIIGLEERHFVERSQEQINAALMEYCIRFYPDMKDKFGQLLLRLPEVRIISIRVEEYLYQKHVTGEVLGQTLLLEMLHSKRK